MGPPAAPPRGWRDSEQSPEAFAARTDELLQLEVQAEEAETTSLLMTCTQLELQARGIALLKLCVAEQTTALYGRPCLTLEKCGSAPMPAHRIGNGDIVGVFDQTSRPLSKAVPLASAVVQRVRPGSIALAFETEIPNEVLDGRPLHVATVSSDVTMKLYREALDVLKTGRVDGPAHGIAQACFGDRGHGPRFLEEKSETCARPDAVDCSFRAEQSHSLNEPQQAAVRKALRAAEVSIVHGPPGTGKTTTLVAYILEAAYRKQRLLVTAPSNVAVDNLLERVVACGCKSVVRLGHPARIQAELHKYTMDNIVYQSDQAALCRDIKKEIEDAVKRCGSKKKEERPGKGEITKLRQELRQRERRAVAEVLRHTQVVFATCAGAATLHREIRRSGGSGGEALEFDVTVIDEAAQALEVACWIPLLLGKKGVLAGDHQQLAACVKSTAAQKEGLDRTLFARLIELYGDDVAALLSIQYRMNATIMGWSSRFFYDSKLQAAESVAHRTLALKEDPAANLVGDVMAMMQAPLLFVDTGGLAVYREDGGDEATQTAAAAHSGAYAAVHQSRANFGEARFLVHYAKLLVRCGMSPRDITVITPYNRQVERLRMDFAEDPDCEKLGLDKPRVNTVDSFQGQEADAVLISLVRSNERGSVGFLADFRRLNVAVTRGRKHVMIVGDAATISGDKTLASLYDYACEAENARVAFVEQLLSEDGEVPPDPASVTAPAQKPKAQRRIDQAHAPKQIDAPKDEDEVRQRMEDALRPLLGAGGCKEFPPSLNPFERAIAHEVASNLGLLHESVGEGMRRRLLVWTPGHERPGIAAGSSDRDGGAPKKGKKGSREKTASSKTDGPGDEDLESDDEDQETPLQAFERRAGATLDSLGPGQLVAEWKSPSDEELVILRRISHEKGLELSEVGSGKKRRCRVELEAPAAAATEDASKTSAVAPSASVGPNAALAALNAERQARQIQMAARKEAEAAERKKQNDEVKAEIKIGKKAGAKKLKAVAAGAKADDDDDLDSVLAEFCAQDGICAFGPCKEKTHTLIDPVSKCKLCCKRFCMKHFQAEAHGCGDAAQKAEQKKFKQSSEAALNARGAGLANKSAPNRGSVAEKLASKIQQSQASRTVKQKERDKK